MPPGGCHSEALKALGYVPNAAPSNPPAVQALDQQPFEASLRTGSVKQTLQNWSACMRDQGYAYGAEPFSVSNDRQFATRSVTAAEKDVATTGARSHPGWSTSGRLKKQEARGRCWPSTSGSCRRWQNSATSPFH